MYFYLLLAGYCLGHCKTGLFNKIYKTVCKRRAERVPSPIRNHIHPIRLTNPTPKFNISPTLQVIISDVGTGLHSRRTLHTNHALRLSQEHTEFCNHAKISCRQMDKERGTSAGECPAFQGISMGQRTNDSCLLIAVNGAACRLPLSHNATRSNYRRPPLKALNRGHFTLILARTFARPLAGVSL